MSYVANQYNYATPLSSAVALVGEQPAVADDKYFTLFDNVLDGSYKPLPDDAGIWGSSLSDASGNLATPFIITVTENVTFNAFRLQGSQYAYPVAFTVVFYNGSTAMYTITETANSLVSYIHYLPRTIVATRYEIRVTKISRGGAVARLYNLYNPGYVKRADNLSVVTRADASAYALLNLLRPDTLMVGCTESRDIKVAATASDSLRLKSSASVEHTNMTSGVDTLRSRVTESSGIFNRIDTVRDSLKIRAAEPSHILKTLGVATDTLRTKLVEDMSHVINTIGGAKDSCVISMSTYTNAGLMNVHSIMKGTSRKIYGKVYITYTDPMLNTSTQYLSSDGAYNSNANQVQDSKAASDGLWFTLYDNDLSGRYRPSDEQSQVGWVSKSVSDASGNFTGDLPFLRIEFSSRPVIELPITFDDSHGSVAKDFTLTYEQRNGNVITKTITGNTEATVVFNEPVAEVVAITITVSSVTKPGYPVAILEAPVLSTQLYVGYKDRSDLVSIDLLEELNYSDEIEALGGLSANVITVTLDNSKRNFFFNNMMSTMAASLRRNRKIVPWLGVEIVPGEIEWYTLGTFWSYRWDVPVEGLTAQVIGFDTLGLLDLTDFSEHTVQVNKSLGELIEYVLADARRSFDFIEHKIDPALYNIRIPYAWFEHSSHTEALRKICKCYPMHVYCDRDGAICAAPQKLHYDYYYDTWSDNTNVISKSYNSLYTTLPNIINVKVIQPIVKHEDALAEDRLVFNVANMPTRTLNFADKYLSDINVVVDCDSTVRYTYNAYAWGIVFNFSGSGEVRSISCSGTAVDTQTSALISKQNAESVRHNGAVTRDVSADFIQTSEHAIELIDRLLTLSELDKYDVEVKYRGDIALSINDPILLLDGLAPDNRYNIKRHELFWNGALTGSAYLNT